MPKRFHSSLILVVVFILGLGGGIAGMIWAWPGLRARYFPHHRPTLAQYLKPLQLTAAQFPQVEAVYKETGERSHALHVQFVPAYSKVCDDYMQVRRQERDAYAPIRQQELDKLHAIMTPEQWQKFQQIRAQQQKNQPQRQPDVCRRLYPSPGGSPGSHPPPPAH